MYVYMFMGYKIYAYEVYFQEKSSVLISLYNYSMYLEMFTYFLFTWYYFPSLQGRSMGICMFEKSHSDPENHS